MNPYVYHNGFDLVTLDAEQARNKLALGHTVFRMVSVTEVPDIDVEAPPSPISFAAGARLRKRWRCSRFDFPNGVCELTAARTREAIRKQGFVPTDVIIEKIVDTYNGLLGDRP